MKTAFLFPGQGAQVVGMGKEIALEYSEAAAIFARANEIVGYDLSGICFEGPQEKLNSTTVSQPAIFTMSAAILSVIRSNPATSGIVPDVTAGLSLGEYTALYASGAISFEDGLKLVQKRGEAMQAAADASEGGMVSIIGLDEDKVNELCDEAREDDVLVAVNFNCPGQIVVSGAKNACQRAADISEKYGAMKAVVLSVAGAFHSEMMAPAAEELKEALAGTEINADGDIKVIANVDVTYYNAADGVRDGLVNQLVKPLRWQKCMEKLLEAGVEDFYEIGPGRVLTGLMRRIHRKTRVNNVSDLKSLNTLIGK
jgi:[acyl-carrier-protein] S-malonyltransferase